MPDTDSIIIAENISKAYRIWKSPADRLKSPFIAGAASLLPKNSFAAACPEQPGGPRLARFLRAARNLPHRAPRP